MAANITSGNNQSYEGPGMRIFQGLQPDVVLIQEFNYDSGSARDFVDATFGTEFHFYREPQKGGIPNGIVSRYPILESGEWRSLTPDRDFAFARIDIPGDTDLWAVSVHLRTQSARARDQEGASLVSFIRSHMPDDTFLVIGGDFNTGSPTEAVMGRLSGLVVTGGPLPADHRGNTKTNATRKKPYDRVLVSPSLDAKHVPVQVGSHSYPTGLVFDSRVFPNLADVAPAMASDSAAVNMQHMPVVRDFEL
jgi:endonuclease/exonuclease/phosphatase family metal-dependent hydrolase